MNTTTRRTAASAVLAAGVALGATTTAHAAQQDVPLDCDGQSLVVRTPTNNAQQSWSVGQLVAGGSGHLIPLSFSFTFTPTGGAPETQTITKGGGHAGPTDPVVTCTSTQTSSDGTFTLSVTAVARP